MKKLIAILLLLTSIVFGQNPYMLSFDGGDYVQKSSLNSISHQTGFFSVWFNATSVASWQTLICVANTVSATRYVAVTINATGQVEVRQRNSDTQDLIETANGAISAGVNTHVAIGTNTAGNGFVICINGDSIESLNVAGGANNGDWIDDVTFGVGELSVAIGRLNTSTPASYFTGTIDEVAWFNVGLTESIASQIYNSGIPNNISVMSGLVGYWKLDEGTGQEASDETGTYDLTLGANSGESTDDPTWSASTFGWDAGETTIRSFGGWSGFGGW